MSALGVLSDEEIQSIFQEQIAIPGQTMQVAIRDAWHIVVRRILAGLELEPRYRQACWPILEILLELWAGIWLQANTVGNEDTYSFSGNELPKIKDLWVVQRSLILRIVEVFMFAPYPNDKARAEVLDQIRFLAEKVRIDLARLTAAESRQAIIVLNQETFRGMEVRLKFLLQALLGSATDQFLERYNAAVRSMAKLIDLAQADIAGPSN